MTCVLISWAEWTHTQRDERLTHSHQPQYKLDHEHYFKIHPGSKPGYVVAFKIHPGSKPGYMVAFKIHPGSKPGYMVYKIHPGSKPGYMVMPFKIHPGSKPGYVVMPFTGTALCPGNIQGRCLGRG